MHSCAQVLVLICRSQYNARNIQIHTHNHTHTHRLRALQISNNAPVMVPLDKGETDPLKIATKELIQGKVGDLIFHLARLPPHAPMPPHTLSQQERSFRAGC